MTKIIALPATQTATEPAEFETLNNLPLIETALANITRDKKAGTTSFIEILDFGAAQYLRTLPTAWENLFSLYLDARILNASAPAALFNALLEGIEGGINLDTLDKIRNLKAKRSNSFFDLLPDYTTEQLDTLAKAAADFDKSENNPTCFDTLQEKCGTTFRMKNGQRGYAYGIVIASFEGGTTFALIEGALCTLFDKNYELHPLPESMHTEILAELTKAGERLEKLKANAAERAEKRTEREAAKAAKTKERAERMQKRLGDYTEKYKIEMPAHMQEKPIAEQLAFAKELIEGKRFADYLNKHELILPTPAPTDLWAWAKAEAAKKADKAKAEAAKKADKAKAAAEKAKAGKPAKAAKAEPAKEGKAKTAPKLDAASIAKAAAEAAKSMAAK